MPHSALASSPSQTLDNLNAIFASVAEGIVMQDASGAIVECNASAERVLGLTCDQMMGRTSIDPRWRAIHDDGSPFPGAEHPAMVALATGRPVRDVIMGVHKPDGTVSWISINAVPILEGGTAVRVVCTFADVTDRRVAEVEANRLRLEVAASEQMLQAIREVQSRYIAHESTSRLFDRMLCDLLALTRSAYGFIGEVLHESDGTPYLKMRAMSDISWDQNTRALYQQHAERGMEFRSLTSLFGRTVATGELVIANDPPRHQHSSGTPHGHPAIDTYLGVPLFIGSTLLGVVGLANRPGGYDHSLAMRLGPYLSTCGQILHASQQQVTRDRVERDLADERERMALVLQASGIGHWDWNPSTDQAMFDARWVGMLGYGIDDIEPNGAQWLRLLHPDDLPATVAAVERHMRGETPEHRAEFRMRHRDGHWVWILAVGRVIERDAQGAVTRMVGVHVDVSEHKAYEAALATATAEAQRANQAKSEFLANMSHEIRTPLNGVIGAAHLLLATPLNEEQRDYSDTIRRSGEILLSLIDDILDLSKIEANRLEVEHIAFDPRDLIAEVAEIEAPRAFEKGVSLIVDWRSHPLASVQGDPKRLRQVLLNLVSNAIKFTERGHVLIAAEQMSPTELQLSVTDTGIGIPHDKQDRVFDTFMQADSSTTRRFGGTGLGLAISRRLVEAMGGTIGVCSVPGRGSTFWFSLPLDQWAQPEPLPDDDVLRGTRALVVDRSDASSTAIARLLGQHGVDVSTRADDTGTLDALRHAAHVGEPFDFLVVDFAPEEFDLPRLVRGLEADPRLEGLALLVTAPSAKRRHVRHVLGRRNINVIRTPMARRDTTLRQCRDSVVRARLRHDVPVGVAGPSQAGPRDAEHVTAISPDVVRRPRVLLAEDNEINRLVAQRMLEKAGCDVMVAEDGRRAVELTGQQAFDLVFMDCEMPEMDGFEATAAIRTRTVQATGTATDPDVPIIAVTAHVLGSNHERCLASGMVDYLAKPISPTAVARVLARWFDASAAQG